MDEIQLKQLTEALEAKLTLALQAHTAEVEKHGRASTEATAKVDGLAVKLNGLVEKLDKLEQSRTIARAGGVQHKSIGQAFVDSKAFEAFAKGDQSRARVDFGATATFLEVKNTILGEGGSPQDPVDTIVPSDRLPGIVGGAFRQLTVLDLIPTGPTSSNKVEFTRELTFTNAAAETAEGVAKPETTLTFELADADVRTIAHFLKVSKQVLEDSPALATYIDRRLRHGVQRRAETQIVNGNGTSPNISGLLDSGNYTVVVPVTGEQQLDTMNRQKTEVLENDFIPTAFLVNPTDWGAIERLKRTDSGYIGADGAGITYIANGLVPIVWGLPVVQSNSVPAGSSICGDFSMGCQAFIRGGVVVEAFAQDEDNVQKNLVTVRGEQRLAFAVFNAGAFAGGSLTQ